MPHPTSPCPLCLRGEFNMPEVELAIPRPQRWDEPFGEVTERDVDRLLTIEPFRSINAGAFPPSLPLHGILRGDTRFVRGDTGEFVVREGDYGHSAFLVLAGTVRVVLERLNPEVLGRAASPRRSWMRAVAQLWQNARVPEVRRSVPGAGRVRHRARGSRGQEAVPLGTCRAARS